jgi:hypothetical protein
MMKIPQVHHTKGSKMMTRYRVSENGMITRHMEQTLVSILGANARQQMRSTLNPWNQCLGKPEE